MISSRHMDHVIAADAVCDSKETCLTTDVAAVISIAYSLCVHG